MKKFLEHPLFILSLKWVVAGLFIYAGILKWSDPLAFADNIAAYQFAPESLINLIALVLPVLEILTGVLLVFRKTSGVAALSVLLMCVVFTGALLWAIVHGLNVDCGCFGGGKPSQLSPWIALGRDLLLILAAGWIYFRERIGFFRMGSGRPAENWMPAGE